MSDEHGRENAEAIQRRIRQAREQVLGGRGPGASPQETARWMHDRPRLGAQPTAQGREDVAQRAVIARGNPGEIEQVIIRQVTQLSAMVGEIGGRLGRARRRARIPAVALLTGTGIALVVRAARRRPPGTRGRR